ncbi:potassium channel family protein [Streptomyces boncukensis]|uniref:Two pore domain potassium channel family protein n=1 Tax=Streptomyces boncukensis TaxID=2711219 RepID=A0A6G4WYE4_9ACTN|nr:potassium channel family protein [Streptomyces boncukensis]NGO70023.1 two pore domain potassium channel family protein [Streptomyces boncukensis]
MEWLVSLFGAALVVITLRDLFHTLWHPTRRGGLSRVVMTALWRLSRPLRTRSGHVAGLAGPLAVVSVVGLWAGTIILGWAIVYWPHMPDSFAFANELRASEHTGLLDSLYLSMVHVSTLGLGDIAPTEEWLRIAAPLEALVGFVLLTATVSWVLEIYPALARRKALALRLAVLLRTDRRERPSGEVLTASLLEGLAADVLRVRIDFTQYAEAYYFHDGEDETSLAVVSGYACELARRGAAASDADVRRAADVLSEALDDLATVLDQRFLHTGGSAAEVFGAYAADHGHRRTTGPAAGG